MSKKLRFSLSFIDSIRGHEKSKMSNFFFPPQIVKIPNFFLNIRRNLVVGFVFRVHPESLSPGFDELRKITFRKKNHRFPEWGAAFHKNILQFTNEFSRFGIRFRECSLRILKFEHFPKITENFLNQPEKHPREILFRNPRFSSAFSNGVIFRITSETLRKHQAESGTRPPDSSRHG